MNPQLDEQKVVKVGVDHTLGNGGCEELTLVDTSTPFKKRRPRFVSKRERERDVIRDQQINGSRQINWKSKSNII